MTSTAPRTEIDETLRLVLAVARLGEVDLKGWWRSHGIDRSGSFVLRRAFPRSWAAAGLELDLLSATRRHDDTLSRRTTALHLFSDELPFRRWASAWLSEQKTKSALDPLIDELTSWTTDSGAEWLQEWSDISAAGEEIGDGLLLGAITSNELEDDEALRRTARQLAGAYLTLGESFRAPYFDLAS